MTRDQINKLVTMGYIVDPYNPVVLDANKNPVLFIDHEGDYFSPVPEVHAVFHEEPLILIRNRDDGGKFVPDDPATPDVNEAWVAAPAKKTRRKTK